MTEPLEDTTVRSEENDDHLDKKTLFVRAIPKEATSEDISEYFSQFVPVKHAVVVTDDEKQSRGFGFVSFTMEDDTLTALVESKKVKFRDRFLRVDIAKRRDRKGKEGAEPRQKEDHALLMEKRKARLIIRNLPWSCKSAETLKKLFLKYGAVHDAYIPMKKGGLMKGFAFVVMKKKAAAERAVKESVGLKIDGREVAVDLALEKSKWEQVREVEEDVKSTGRERESGNELIKEEDDTEIKEEENSEVDSESGDDDEEFDELNGDKVKEEVDDMVEDEEEEEEDEDKEKQNKQEAFSIFVRNIPYDADKDSLKTHFSQFGPVKYALPVIDKVTGLAKGSAFVAFKTEEGYTSCLLNAPSVSTTSMLISDDVLPKYVYQGRILSIVSTVDRSSASKLAERNLLKRKELYGKEVGDKDRRNLFLLNEGRITQHSKLAEIISKTDMEVREKSYKLRVQQLNKNPTLHLSLTRLAIRNLPRAMTSKALKALGRKAVVEFATEVKDGKRQPLSKEEISRSTKAKHEFEEDIKVTEDAEKKKKKGKHSGVVKQAKVIMEIKGTGEAGRSRGYGFLEFRDHKSALMGLRWLNAHEVTNEEIMAGLDEEEQKIASLEGITKRRLIVEFAIENAQVVKRRKDKVFIARNNKRKREEGEEEDIEQNEEGPSSKKQKKGKKGKKGNMNKGPKSTRSGETKEDEKKSNNKSGLPEDVKQIIGKKRKLRKWKK